MPKLTNQKQHGIIFQDWGVVAIQKKLKTQTRRLIKPQPSWRYLGNYIRTGVHSLIRGVHKITVGFGMACEVWSIKCKYGDVGGLLWIRETWHTDETDLEYARAKHEDVMSESPIFYKADKVNDDSGCIWKPSIHMPRWTSRIDLKTLSIGAERVQEISEADIKAEGIEWRDLNIGDNQKETRPKTLRGRFKGKWNKIHLTPKPVMKKIDGKKQVGYYESYPFDISDFKQRFPELTDTYRSKPLLIYPNPWVWKIVFEMVK